MKLASIIERYQHQLLQQNPIRLEQRNALTAILGCRSEHFGQMQLECENCNYQQTTFHSCGHRSCPSCQHHDTSQWIERQKQKLLPVDYFMVTFTLPREFRSLVYAHQNICFNKLFECSISTLKDFANNSAKLGGDIGMTAVLHTHSRRLDFHPHVHIIVPGGCVNKKRKYWKKLKGRYLFNALALAKVFRARFLSALHQANLQAPTTYAKKWIVDCTFIGKGLPTLKYLARYLYRSVISEKNIIHDDGSHVTFQYKESKSKKFKTRKLKGADFIRLLLQHVLPKGFRRSRDYGFNHGNAKKTLFLVQHLMKVKPLLGLPLKRPLLKCARCQNPMKIICFIRPAWKSG